MEYENLTKKELIARIKKLESEEKYSLVVENSNDAILIYKKEEIVYSNPKVYNYIGINKNEIIGKDIFQFIAPQYHEEVKRRNLARFEGKETQELTYIELIKKDTTLLPVEINTSVITYEEETALLVFIRDISERKRIEIDLIKSQERYAALVENSSDGVIVHKNGKVIFANQIIKEEVGYNVDDVIGKNLIDFVAPNFRELVIQHGADRLAGKEIPKIYEIEIIAKDGSFFPVEINSSIINYDGEIATLVFIRNISVRKIVEDKLKASEAKFSKIYQNSPSAIYITSLPEGKFLDVNSKFEEFSGYSRHEVINKTVTELNFYLNEEDRTKLLDELKNKHRLNAYELRFKVKNGDIIDCLIFSEFIELEGKQRLLSIVNDITDRINKSEQLRKSETVNKALLNATLDMALLMDKYGNIITVNKAMAVSLRSTSDQLIGRNIHDLLPPELAKVRWAKIKGSAKLGKLLRFIDQQGDRWFDNSIYPIFNDQKKISQYAIFSQDISDLKKAEQELISSEQRFSLAMQGANDGLFDWDLSDNSIYFSRRWKEMLGYSDTEIKNEFDSWVMLLHPDDADKAKQKVNEFQAGND